MGREEPTAQIPGLRTQPRDRFFFETLVPIAPAWEQLCAAPAADVTGWKAAEMDAERPGEHPRRSVGARFVWQRGALWLPCCRAGLKASSRNRNNPRNRNNNIGLRCVVVHASRAGQADSLRYACPRRKYVALRSAATSRPNRETARPGPGRGPLIVSRTDSPTYQRKKSCPANICRGVAHSRSHAERWQREKP